jgi:hypothetical protein
MSMKSFQHPADEMIVDDALIPLSQLDKLSCQTMRGLAPQRRSDNAARQVEAGPRRMVQRALAAIAQELHGIAAASFSKI